MNDLTYNLHEVIRNQLHQTNFDVIGLIPVPSHSDRMVRLRTLQEILEDLQDSSTGNETLEYLLQIRPKHPQQPQPQKTENNASSNKPSPESIYLPNGKLNIPYLIRNADLLFDAGDYALARNIYKTVLTSGEYTSAALYRLGRCFEAEGKIEESRANYEDSIAYLPTLEAYQRLSALLIRQGKDQQAAEVMERALNLKEIPHSTRYELYKACGNCWTRAQKSEDAERNFKKALEVNPAADEVRANLGVLYLQGHKISEAKRHFRDATASNPNNPQALSGLGSCCLAEGDKKSAHDYFAQSLQIELNNPTAIFYLVKCAYEIKSYAIATKILQEYIQIAPVNTNLLYSLAGLQFHLGRIAEAKATTSQILELQAQHGGAKELLNMIERYAGPSHS
jgi:tetratricopeptide (TPR) repeat protein